MRRLENAEHRQGALASCQEITSCLQPEARRLATEIDCLEAALSEVSGRRYIDERDIELKRVFATQLERRHLALGRCLASAAMAASAASRGTADASRQPSVAGEVRALAA